MMKPIFYIFKLYSFYVLLCCTLVTYLFVSNYETIKIGLASESLYTSAMTNGGFTPPLVDFFGVKVPIVEKTVIETPKPGQLVTTALSHYTDVVKNKNFYVAIDKHSRDSYFFILAILFLICLYAYYKKLSIDSVTKLLNPNLMKKYHNQDKYNYITYITIVNLDRIKISEGIEYASNVINCFAGSIQKCFSSNDKIFRVYGDHFVVFTEYSLESIEARLVILRANAFKKQITFNCGVKKITSDIKLDLFASAEAMYANSLNDSCLFYSYEKSKEVQEYIDGNIVKDVINKALKDNVFDVNFQPKFDLNTGRIYGAEALARLCINGTHYSPQVFVDYLEQCGGIPKLDYIVLEQTIEFIKKSGFIDILFSINLSSESIICDHFKRDLRKLLTKNKMLENLEFEITESILPKHKNEVFAFITEIRNDFSVRFSLDDFSTGNSSLVILSEFRFDCVKLDRSLLTAMHNNDEFKFSMKVLINEIKKFSDEIVFEGIERVCDESIVVELGVNKVQGWKYSKPLTENKFITLINSDFNIRVSTNNMDHLYE